MEKQVKRIVAVSGLLLFVGCQPAAVNVPEQTTLEAPDSEPFEPARRKVTDAPEASPAETAQPTLPADTPTAEPEVARDVARVGVGRKGRGYGGGLVSEPARQFFGIRERLVFDAQIPQALNTYKALDPAGKGPKTHDEFMAKVIKENGIQLPELPDGQRYVYEAESETLMVERPAN